MLEVKIDVVPIIMMNISVGYSGTYHSFFTRIKIVTHPYVTQNFIYTSVLFQATFKKVVNDETTKTEKSADILPSTRIKDGILTYEVKSAQWNRDNGMFE